MGVSVGVVEDINLILVKYFYLYFIKYISIDRADISQDVELLIIRL